MVLFFDSESLALWTRSDVETDQVYKLFNLQNLPNIQITSGYFWTKIFANIWKYRHNF